MQPRARAFASIVATAGLAACAHAPDAAPASQTTTTGASFTLGSSGPARAGAEPFSPEPPDLSDPAHPANRIGRAACERKVECDEIGEGKAYATADTCVVAARRRAHEALDRLSCEGGLDEARLDGCVAAVRRAECERVDRMGEIEACTRARLCAR